VDVPALGSVLLFDIGGAVAATGLGLTFIWSSMRNTRALYRAEPRPGYVYEARIE
jgi:hypothetical protein